MGDADRNPQSLTKRLAEVTKFSDIPRIVTTLANAAGCVVLVRKHDGSIEACVDGVNHSIAVWTLAQGIHAILGDHDRRVLTGEAGPEAQAAAREIEKRKQINGG